jgi:hypothetical protein
MRKVVPPVEAHTVSQCFDCPNFEEWVEVEGGRCMLSGNDLDDTDGIPSDCPLETLDSCDSCPKIRWAQGGGGQVPMCTEMEKIGKFGGLFKQFYRQQAFPEDGCPLGYDETGITPEKAKEPVEEGSRYW